MTPERDSSTLVDRRTVAALIAIVLVAAIPRVAGLESRSLWGDEIASLAYASGYSYFPWHEHTEVVGTADHYRRYVSIAPGYFSQRLVSVLRTEAHPPFYYVILNLWLHAFGTSEAALRSLSALASLASIPLFYALGRHLVSPPVGLAAALLSALAPLPIAYADYARPYALLGFFALLSTLLALRLAAGAQSWSLLLSYGAVALLGLYTHYLFLWNIVFHGIVVTGSRRADLRFLIRWGLVLVGVALAFAPWLPLMQAQLRWNREAPSLTWFYWASGTSSLLDAILHEGRLVALMLAPGRIRGLCAVTEPGATCLPDAALTALFYGVAIAIIAVSGWRLIVYTLARRNGPVRGQAWAICLLWGACVFGIPFLFDLIQDTHTITNHRYFIAGSGPVCLLVAMGVATLSSVRLRIAALGAVALFLAAGSTLYLGGFSDTLIYPQGMREVAEHLERSATEGDLVLMLNPGPEPKDLAYYLRANLDLGRINIPGRWWAAPAIPHHLEAVTKGRPRVWYLDGGGPEKRANDETVAWLEARYPRVDTARFKNLRLFVFSSPTGDG
jgi:uncharacterized membrane protein